MMEKLWTTQEAAACLGVSEAEVESLVRDGKLTGYKLGGQFLRFRPDQVQALRGHPQPVASDVAAPRMPLQDSWLGHIQDFVYFYDFYFVSALMLAALVIYLVASGR